MCGLCGVLGGPRHWTDAPARLGVFTRNTDEAQRRRERRNRVTELGRVLCHYGVRLEDWQASSFVLSNRTGGTELVDDLAHVWTAAERLSGLACDPLDPGLLDLLEASRA